MTGNIRHCNALFVKVQSNKIGYNVSKARRMRKIWSANLIPLRQFCPAGFLSLGVLPEHKIPTRGNWIPQENVGKVTKSLDSKVKNKKDLVS